MFGELFFSVFSSIDSKYSSHIFGVDQYEVKRVVCCIVIHEEVLKEIMVVVCVVC